MKMKYKILNKRYKIIFLILFSLFGLAQKSLAADLHVGSEQPYSTIASAISASSYGDNIIIHEGTYGEYYLSPKSGTTLISAKRFDSNIYGNEDMPVVDAGQTSYTGTSDNYDTFVFYPAKSDVVIDGLKIKGGGWCNINFADVSNTNITIQHCILEHNHWVGSYNPDNGAAIYIKAGNNNITIQHNTIYVTKGGVNGIQGYQSSEIVIRNNDIHMSNDGTWSESSHGIFWKHASTGTLTVENNVVHSTCGSSSAGIFIRQIGATVKNNLIIGSDIGYGIITGMEMGYDNCNNITFTHNTVYGARSNGNRYEGSTYPNNNTFTNNVYVNNASPHEYGLFCAWYYGASWTSYAVNTDYNCYYQPTSETMFNIGYSPSYVYTLAQWQNLGHDAHSIVELPGFKNTSGAFSEIADFEIISGDANNGASDGTDMGANISLVGPDADESSDTTPPATPAGLSVS